MPDAWRIGLDTQAGGVSGPGIRQRCAERLAVAGRDGVGDCAPLLAFHPGPVLGREHGVNRWWSDGFGGKLHDADLRAGMGNRCAE